MTGSGSGGRGVADAGRLAGSHAQLGAGHTDLGGGHDDHHHGPELPPEQNPIWQQDNVTLTSVGIDIGSAGTQVAFSRLHLRRLAEDLTSRYTVVRRETRYQSPVALTPYADQHQIDSEALGTILDLAYHRAGQRPEEIDTGAVILTGEALRRQNAERIAGIVASRGGDMVCASAGHHMEARLAAYGSGAVRASYDTGGCILNVDIGGGTTKLSLAVRGEVTATAALHVGGRLIAVDHDNRITRLEPGGRRHAARAGYDWSLGDVVCSDQVDRVAELMAEAVLAAITESPVPRPVGELFLTEPLGRLPRLDGVMFSGGVAEYVYRRETRDFGDLGARLGAAIRARIDAGALTAPLLPPGECIRATVLGASEYTVQLSGNTCYISRPDALLPRRNLPVLRPRYVLGEIIEPEALGTAIRQHLTGFDIDRTEGDVAVALSWSGPPSYQRVLAFAQGIRYGLAERIEAGRPAYLVLDGDVALTVGSLLADELGVGSDLMVIDGVRLTDFDYIDLGRLRTPSHTVPVTVKSLIFNAGMDPAADTDIERADVVRDD